MARDPPLAPLAPRLSTFVPGDASSQYLLVTVDRGPPYAGSSIFYSGPGGNLGNVMHTQLNLRTSEREICV